MKKTIGRLIVWTLLCAPAYAQSPQLGAGQVLGNSTGAQRPAQAVGLSSLFDRAFCSTANSALARISGSWTCLATANNSIWATNSSGVPALTQTLPSAVQDNITRLGTIISGTWNGGVIPQLYGGTGATDAIGGRGALGLGTMATQNATGVAITGGTITGLPTPTSSNDAATKSYADSIASGLSIRTAVQWATAAVLPNTPTYANGTAGVGATLTSTGNAALVVDGGSPTVGQRVLVKNEATTSHNGVFSVTAAGSGAAQWVLTRVTDFDQPGEMIAGAAFAVVGSGGATNSGTGWSLSAAVTTVGTDPLSFNQFQSIAGALVASNNLSDVTSATTARTNLGLGTMATQNANSVAITGGTAAVTNLTVSTTAGALVSLGSLLTPSMTNGQRNYFLLGSSTASNNGFYFAYNHDSTAANRWLGIQATEAGVGTQLALTAAGNVGIGTASPAAQLHTTGSVRFANLTCAGAGGLGALDSSGNFTCLDFTQTGTGAVARQWQAKVGETVSIADFGGSTGASAATNTTALSNAVAVNGFTMIPPGDFTTNTNFMGGSSSGQIYGPGTLIDSASHRRGRWIINFNSSLTGWAVPTDPATWYNADTSKMAIAAESIVTVPPVPRPTGTVAAPGALAGATVIPLTTVTATMGFAANTAAALYVTDTTSGSAINFGTQIKSVAVGTPGTIELSAPLAGNVSTSDAIVFGNGQYTAQAEASTIAAYVSTAANTLNVGQTNTAADIAASRVSGQYLSQFRCQFFNGAAGGGGNCYDGTVTVNAAYPSYNQSNPANTVNVGMFAGSIILNADNAWLDPIDVGVIDNGHPATFTQLQANLTRTVAKTYDAQRWTGLNANLGTSSALSADAVIRGSGWVFYGIDFTNVLVPSGGPMGGRPAIALAEGHGIAFNTTGTVNGATNAGLAFIQRDTSSHNLFLTNANLGTSGMEISTANTVYFPSAAAAGPRVVVGAGSGGSGGFLQVGPGLLASSNTNIGIPFFPLSTIAIEIQAQTADTGNALYFNNSSGTNVGSISMTTTGTAFTTVSDIRLKRDFEPISEAGDILDALRPSKFRWRSDGSVGFGVPAQQTFDVFPAAVTRGDDHPDAITTAWSVDYSKFVPLLMADHQDLRRRMSAVEKALNARQ